MTFPTFKHVMMSNGETMLVDTYGTVLGIFPDISSVMIRCKDQTLSVRTTAGKFIFNTLKEKGVYTYSFYRFIAEQPAV
jgi:hypothetical protein